MKVTGADLINKNTDKIVQQYMLIEFKKMFSDITDIDFWEKFEISLAGLKDRTTPNTFYGMLSGISESIQLNSIHQYLTNDKYSWTLENISINKILLTGMNPIINKYTLDVCSRNPKKFVKQWKNDAIMRIDLISNGFDVKIENNVKFPIITFKEGDKFVILDGMHRTLTSIIANKKHIKGWVGRIAKSNGQPLINNSQSMFLFRTWKNAKNKNDDLKNALCKIGSEILKNYRNGHESLIDRIASWSSDEEFKNIFKKIKYF